MSARTHDAKFAALLAHIEATKTRKMKVVFVDSPRALGDTCEEICANLDKIADAELPLHIVPRRHRVGKTAG